MQFTHCQTRTADHTTSRVKPFLDVLSSKQYHYYSRAQKQQRDGETLGIETFNRKM
jgi:hypothetical protein